MKNIKIKQEFAIKKPSELDKLSHEELLKYIKDLQKRLVKEKPKKNSNNSSIAPATDITRPKKNQSLRDKSDKKVGGQKGRVGKNLTQTDEPDKVEEVNFNIKNCKKCDEPLKDVEKELKERRQVLDLELSRIETEITEYQSFSKICPLCGFENHDNEFPHLVAPHISYGANITAMVSYLSVSQYLSYNRIISLMSNLFKVNISYGVVDKMIKRASKLSEDEISKIVEALEISSIVGIDETGCKVNGEKYWHWAFQNSENTLIVANKSRGTTVINENFENGFVNACIVHDNYSSYNSLVANSEQLCLAHKLRDINYAIDCDNTEVMKNLKSVIQEAMIDHKENFTIGQREILKREYDKILEYLLNQKATPKSETQKQLNSFRKAYERNQIFTFLEHPNIPPDNNGSERAIRNIKVKLKVSGQFKSFQGAKDYANLRSIVDTSRKRGLNEFESLVGVISGESIF
jgi:UDP-N-acetylglucosamine transferase subunit ALG13